MNYELKTVVPGRLELPTSTLSVWRSDQLTIGLWFPVLIQVAGPRTLLRPASFFSLISKKQMQQYKNYLEPPCGNSWQVVLQTLMRNITL